MTDLSEEIRRRYLDRLEDPSWDDEDPRLDFASSAMPYFIAALQQGNTPPRRPRLVRVISQFRDSAALPTLAIALRDPFEHVWKNALDGMVALGGNQALAVLNEALAMTSATPAETEKFEWIHEAVTQVAEAVDGGNSKLQTQTPNSGRGNDRG